MNNYYEGVDNSKGSEVILKLKNKNRRGRGLENSGSGLTLKLNADTKALNATQRLERESQNAKQ
jgi:hypothetical protein